MPWTGLSGSLKIHVLSAKDLRACDMRGISSDPYCIFTCVPEPIPRKVKTSVKRKTLNPAWEETLSLAISRAKQLCITVKDYNFLGMHDVCGEAVIDLETCPFVDGQVSLCVALTPQGDLRLALEFLDEKCLFGLDIARVCRREGASVPHIVTRCITAIETFGLDSGAYLYDSSAWLLMLYIIGGCMRYLCGR